MKKIVILNRHNGRSDDLEALLKKLFPECEICNALVIDKDGKSHVHLNLIRAKKGNEKNSSESS